VTFTEAVGPFLIAGSAMLTACLFAMWLERRGWL
jgi:hypothetical protein